MFAEKHNLSRLGAGNTEEQNTCEFSRNSGSGYPAEILLEEQLLDPKDNQQFKSIVRMKGLLFAIVIFIASAMTICHSVSAQKVLLTLPAGEQLLYPESSLTMFDKEGGLQVCTVDQQGKFYIYKNNNKIGPFLNAQKAANQISFPDYDQHDEKGQAINQNYNSEFVLWDDAGNSYIKFGEKQIGPFRFIKELFIAPNGKSFIAVVAEPGPDANGNTRFQFLCSNGKTIELTGEPLDLKVDQTVQFAVVASRVEKTSQANLDASKNYNSKIEELIAKMGEGELSMEQLVKYSEELNKLQEQSQSQKTESYQVFTSTGEIFGPFQSYIEPGFGYNGGTKWYMYADGKLYISGKPVKEIKDYNSITGFWWSKNGNNYAYRTGESIVFSSGQTYSNPIEIKVVEENGQTILKWLTFENESKFVFYQKTL